ncbi:MAG: hypothetical protein ABW168_15690 [Sedimenticola sp.]
MSYSKRWRVRRARECAIPFFCLALSGCLLPTVLLAADEDEYLSEINSEGQKLGKRTAQDQAAVNDTPVVTKRAGAGFTSGLSIDEFEAQLQEKYTGSAVFYKKLELRSQEEIYGAYLGGASYTQVRKKIMDFFLQRR